MGNSIFIFPCSRQFDSRSNLTKYLLVDVWHWHFKIPPTICIYKRKKYRKITFKIYISVEAAIHVAFLKNDQTFLLRHLYKHNCFIVCSSYLFVFQEPTTVLIPILIYNCKHFYA